MPELEKKFDDFTKTATDLISETRKAVDDNKKSTSELKAKQERIEVDLKRQYDEYKEALEAEKAAREEMEAKLRTAPTDTKAAEDKGREAVKSAFGRMMLLGNTKGTVGQAQMRFEVDGHEHKSMEFKTFATDSDPAGGYAAYGSYLSSKIHENLFEISPMMQVADVESIPEGDTWVELGEAGAFTVSQVAERGTRSTTDRRTFDKLEIPTHAVYAEPALTQKMAQMARFDFEPWMTRRVERKIGQTVNAYFITGTGVGQPTGVTVSSRLSSTNSGVADDLPSGSDFTIFLDIIGKIKSGYANKKWYMNLTTWIECLKEYQDGTGRLLFLDTGNRGGNVNLPYSLFGYPVVEMPDMPDIGANAYPILFGDMKSGYKIITRPQMVMIRDDVTSKGNIILYVEKYYGGDVYMAEALHKLKCST